MNVEADHSGDPSLAQFLMAPTPTERAFGLYTLEVEARSKGNRLPLATLRRLERFTGRGIPYYAPLHPGYRAWVAQALCLWDQLKVISTEGANSREGKAVSGGNPEAVACDGPWAHGA